MESGELPREKSWWPYDSTGDGVSSLMRPFKRLLSPLASLRLTVALFAMAIFLIFVGTLAQVDKGMWEVMDDYFTAWFAWVEFQVFFPRPWFPNFQDVPFSFLFPGGKLIGLAMFINLVAAHTVRFTARATGTRLVSGLAILLVGALLTFIVITSGHNRTGLQGKPPFEEWRTLWLFSKIALSLLSVASAYAFVSMLRRKHVTGIALTGPFAVVMLIVTGWVWLGGEHAYLGDSGMRILWQLIQGGLVAGFLLAGCAMLFARRAGIVLIHAGVGLLMFGQFYVGKYDVEEQMTIAEGGTANYAHDIRRVELAVIDRNAPDFPDEEVVVSVPLSKNGKPTWLQKLTPIRHVDLPFDIEVIKFFQNSSVEPLPSGHSNPATAGKGRMMVAKPVRANSGADSGGGVDLASAYIRFNDPVKNEDLGTYLLSQVQLRPRDGMPMVSFDETVEVGGRAYEVVLRFERQYKPYSFELLDFRKEDYLGTTKAKSYTSRVRLVDKDRKTDREVTIWMNNPMRYAGETFYQSSWGMDAGKIYSVLQVVKNGGWMIPYVACMFVAVGMGAHFSLTLSRFLNRQQAVAPGNKPSLVGRAVPIAVALVISLVFLGDGVVPPKPAEGELKIFESGNIPVVDSGRVKPLDTLARNSLRVISEREEFVDKNGETQPAIRWLLDVISHSDDAKQHAVFRITNLELLDTLGLRRRKRYRYAFEEFEKQMEEFREQVRRAGDVPTEELTFYQKKVLEFEEKLQLYFKLHEAYRIPDTDLSDPLDMGNYTLAISRVSRDLESAPVPYAVPTESADRPWEPLVVAAARQWVRDIAAERDKQTVDALAEELTNEIMSGESLEGLVRARLLETIVVHLQQEPPGMSAEEARGRAETMMAKLGDEMPDEVVQPTRDSVLRDRDAMQRNLENALASTIGGQRLDIAERPTTRSLVNWLTAYQEGDAATFNRELAAILDLYQRNPPAEYNPKRVTYEAAFNRFAPFYRTLPMYVVAFLLTTASWISWRRPLNRTAFWVLVIAIIVHSLALVARMYISGRPPITNLYSSAVFIGWGCVALALILEQFYGMGFGNAVAALAGFATLLIAHFLAAGGDTIAVLEAVLDTQFWLATHVVCITLGYATTYVAGLLGVVYILGGVLTPALSTQNRKLFSRSIYGVICFAMFFSFVGTVLGGLWADDSWGRFWGWDPKENGALIIVLWNAIVLHARWGAMVKERGLAVLAVAGNIAVSWSWFGVNELGVGLHSYGFTEGVLRALGTVVLAHLLLIMVGLMPTGWWWSYRGSVRS